MKHISVAFVALLLLSAAVPAAAQSPVSIKFDNGFVTLVARNAPVRTILAEWARVGGSKIINGERVVGNPLTLEINHEPERKALAILLRNVSGYVAASRASTSTGASSFDRIHILPNPPPAQTTQPAVATTRPPQPTQPSGVVRFFAGDPNDANDNGDFNAVGANLPARPAQVPQPVMAQPAGGPSPTVSMPTVTIPRQGQGDEQPERSAAPPTTPSFPGAIGSGRPGEITPAPNQQPRRQEDAR